MRFHLDETEVGTLWRPSSAEIGRGLITQTLASTAFMIAIQFPFPSAACLRVPLNGSVLEQRFPKCSFCELQHKMHLPTHRGCSIWMPDPAPKGASWLPKAPSFSAIPNIYNKPGNLLSLKLQFPQMEQMEFGHSFGTAEKPGKRRKMQSNWALQSRDIPVAPKKVLKWEQTYARPHERHPVADDVPTPLR